jgi:hypothetical protein
MSDPLNPHYDDDAVTYDSDIYYADEAVIQPTPTRRTHMAKLKLNTSRMNPAQLIAKADLVLPKIATDAPATPPVPNMAARAAALKAARDKAKEDNDTYEAAKAGLRALKEARDASADELRLEHTFMGSALEAETRGDPVALSATGYELADANTTPLGAPEKIGNFKLSAGDDPGNLDGSFDPDGSAYIYELQCTTGDPVNGPWENCPSTTVSVFRLTGMTSGQRIWARARGVGTQGPGPWSDPYTKIVP